ncbi:MAG: class I SAM-dependent methyltransferase [Armatimonadetes bacterium]|nr:class I SAM-dependent methyltransferase [Armatimonadota bacterium]
MIFGWHWCNREGWLILNEEGQDVTRPLAFPSESMDVIFTEHVIEHVPFEGALHFFAEAHRVLRPGGVFRVVCPTFEKLQAFDAADPEIETYVQNALTRGRYAEADARLRALGLRGLDEDRRLFFYNNIFTEHGHRFIWTAALMKQVLQATGFSDVGVYEPGGGHRQDCCVERKRRGVSWVLTGGRTRPDAPGWIPRASQSRGSRKTGNRPPGRRSRRP